MRSISSRILLALALAAPAAALAQTPQAPSAQPGEQLVDRVVATVGDTVLLYSDVQVDLEAMQARGRPLPTDPEEFARLVRQLVEQRIDDLVLIQAARASGVIVLESEVQPEVDKAVADVRQNFPSEEAMNEALARSGRTMAQYRQALTQQYMDQRLIQRFVGQRLSKLPRHAVTDQEVREAFERQREQLQPRAASVSFQQVVVTAAPTDSARAAARRLADEVLAKARAGEDFEGLARRYSQDQGSKERGGDLGWFRQGTMVRPFEDAAYAMRPGEISPVIESEFGFHVIKLERIRGGERQARHVLIKPEVTESDVARARARADSVATAVRAGADLAALSVAYGTDPDERIVRRAPSDQLPPGYSIAVTGVGPGQVAGPFQVENPRRGTEFVVLRLTERQEAGPPELEDWRERIRNSLQEQKQIGGMLAELRRDTHIAVNL